MNIARLPDGGPEVFHTLQGEGTSLGAPAVFLRLSRCNLSCQWCDTPYTWNFSDSDRSRPELPQFDRKSQTIALPPAEVREVLSQFPCDRLVITGGEPLLQQKEIVELLTDWSRYPQVEIETNGTVTPLPALVPLVSQFNVSPKLAHSGDSADQRLRPKALSAFQQLPRAWFKFVVTELSGLDEIEDLIATYALPRDRVLLMPEGRSAAAMAKSSLPLAEACIARGLRFSPRLHVLLWGDERAK